MLGKGIKTLAIAGLLIVATMVAMAPSASATRDLKVTDYNLNILQVLTNSGTAWYSYGTGLEPQLLKYDYGTLLNTYGKSKTAVYVGSRKAIRIGNGECVDFAKAVSGTINTASSSWTRGNRVFDDGSIAQGTMIAKFNSDGSYDSKGGTGHVAVFDRWHWVYQGGGQWIIDGFYVWDQNYVVSYLTGRHLLKQTGSGVSNANNYYVVKVP